MLRLLKDPSFFGVTVAQFFAALNDNAMRQAFLLIVVESAAQELQASASALFALPFIAFSAVAGQLSDRYSKRTVIVLTKGLELAVVLLAAYALWADRLMVLLVAILLMATQSAFFSPAKYGILPEILSYEDLTRGNGLIQMTTYVAILLGAAVAGILLQFFPVTWTGITLVVLGVVGFLPVFLIERVEPADPEAPLDWNSFRSVAKTLVWIRRDPLLFASMLGFTFFFFLGTILTLNLNVYGLRTMGVGEAYTSLLMVFLSVGLGAGSLLAGYVSGDTIDPGLVVLGALGLGPPLVAFTRDPESLLLAYAGMVVIGVFGGFFLIPLQTLIQERPPEDAVGDALGTTNILTFVGVLVASAVYVVLIGWLEFSAGFLMLALGVASVLVGVSFVLILPPLLVRCLGWPIARIFCRSRVRGAENLPLTGPGILVVRQETPLGPFLFGGRFARFLAYVETDVLRTTPLVGGMIRGIPVDELGENHDREGAGVHEDEFLYFATDSDRCPPETDEWEKLGNYAEEESLPVIPVSIEREDNASGLRPSFTLTVGSPHDASDAPSLEAWFTGETGTGEVNSS